MRGPRNLLQANLLNSRFGGKWRQRRALSCGFGAFRAKTELAIIILPLLVGRNRFVGVPVLCDFSVLYSEQIVKRCLLPAERALVDPKHEIPLAKHLVDPVALLRDPSTGHCLQRTTKPRQLTVTLRIVLNV